MRTRNFSNIDFGSFLNNLTLKGMIEEFKQKQESLQTPQPSRRKRLYETSNISKYKKQFQKKSPFDCLSSTSYVNSLEFETAVNNFLSLPEYPTTKYVWFIAPKSERPEITRYGILFNRKKFEPQVFNNGSDIDLFIPFINAKNGSENYHNYDFWRVDTELVANEWRICQNLSDNNSSYFKKKWICTNQDISLEAIQLFEYRGNDAYKNDTFTQLKPVYKVNELINFILRRAA
jgi:hypothetical protein